MRIAVDGRCASGKSTFGRWLSEETGAELLHMDDYFLRPEQRTKQRYETPGENVDHERFLKEVLKPLSEGRPYTVQPFDCTFMALSEAEERMPKDITVVEGSYSLHPELSSCYDLKVFMNVRADKQLERIKKRNPDKAELFRTKWIPYEEMYFRAYNTESICDYVIDTSDFF